MHIAIIMDGNGRWAQRRGMPRPAGHVAGANAVRRVVTAATRAPEIRKLTLYAFSTANWQRPRAEVRALMQLFDRHLQNERERCVRNGVRLEVIGRRDRLGAALNKRIEAAESATAAGRKLHLRLAIDYSARSMICAAARQVMRSGGGRGEQLEAALERALGSAPVDLLIRSGGERRLSDFLLWECAYAELVFLDRLWPEFSAADLGAALSEYRHRERRFGAISPDVPQAM